MAFRIQLYMALYAVSFVIESVSHFITQGSQKSICITARSPVHPRCISSSNSCVTFSMSKCPNGNRNTGVTNNVITSQVASGLLTGLFPDSDPKYSTVNIQSSNFDSLEPTYPCPVASTLRSSYTTGSSGQLWQTHLSEAAPLYAKLDAVSGISPTDNAGWHTSFDQYVPNLYK